MQNNIQKVSERGENLDNLQHKTDNLAVSAQGFRRGANRVRKQMWWKVSTTRNREKDSPGPYRATANLARALQDMKMRMCLIAGIIILILVIVVPAGMYPSFSSRFWLPRHIGQIRMKSYSVLTQYLAQSLPLVTKGCFPHVGYENETRYGGSRNWISTIRAF